MSTVVIPPTDRLVASPLLPDGFKVPASRFTHPSTRMRQLLDSEGMTEFDRQWLQPASGQLYRKP